MYKKKQEPHLHEFKLIWHLINEIESLSCIRDIMSVFIHCECNGVPHGVAAFSSTDLESWNFLFLNWLSDIVFADLLNIWAYILYLGYLFSLFIICIPLK